MKSCLDLEEWYKTIESEFEVAVLIPYKDQQASVFGKRKRTGSSQTTRGKTENSNKKFIPKLSLLSPKSHWWVGPYIVISFSSYKFENLLAKTQIYMTLCGEEYLKVL